MDARIESTAVRFSLRPASRPAFPAPSPCLPPSSCPDLIRASTVAAASPDGALYRWCQWLRGSSPRMGGRIKSGHDGVGVAVEEHGSRVRPAPPVGARNEAGVTTEGHGRQVRACGDPCPDPADAPISRPEQGFAPGPAHINRTAVDSIRASTGAAASPDGALYRWRQWLRGSSPRMGGRIKSGHDGVVVAVEEYGSRVRPAPPVGARNEAGVTTEGQGRQVRACGDPCPDPADAPISRPEQGFAPGPAHINWTAVEQVRA